MYCTEADLLRWEPRLHVEAADVALPAHDDAAAPPAFEAQRRIISGQLAEIAARGASETLLRRAAALGTLHLIYAALVAAAPPGAEADATVRRELYHRLFRRSLRGIVAAFAIDARDDDDADDPLAPRGRPRLSEVGGD